MTIEWKPVSKMVLAVGVAAAALFWLHALTDKDGFLLLDYVNLPIHEAGHLVFGIFGSTLGIWGGTLLQVIFPAAFAVYFALKGETTGTVFGAFWSGENLLYTARYIADARALDLPLVGGGEHDWNTILTDLGLLEQNKAIADVVMFLGWVIMFAAVVWFVSRALKRGYRTGFEPPGET